MLEEIAQFIQAVGFPVAVAAFLLWKMNGKLDRLTEAVDMLRQTMERHEASRKEREP